jgi:hemerythrin
MALIEWKEEFSVGVATIDEQHKRLIALMNGLHDAMAAGAANTVMDKTLADLIDYTVYHFGTEEKLFAQYQYPQAAVHKNQHDDLTKTAKKLQSEFKTGKTLITLETMHFLRSWLNDHILQVDKAAGKYLAGKGAK